MKILLPICIRNIKKITLALIVLFRVFLLPAQTTKQVNHQFQSWFSVNTNTRINDHWAILGDVHMRRNHFLAQNSFEFIRSAVQYSFDKNLSVAVGYGHMWLYPSTPGWKTVSNEDRIYEQAVLSSKFHKAGITQRFRLEQRWQQKISADKFSGDYRFTSRFRYLLSFVIPVFKNDKLPQLNVSDEICLQAGKEVIYNTFDQNRIFIGIRQRITRNLSFDTGYMSVTQQKYSGYQFDLNNTFRLFFYYSPSLSKKYKSS